MKKTSGKVPQSPNEIINAITKGIPHSASAVVMQARIHRVPIISWQNGKIVEIDPNTIEIDD